MTTTTVTESHMVAIQTKYFGPTNYNGSRIRVWRADSSYNDDPHRLTVSWHYALGVGENHTAAIRLYVERAGWDRPNGRWVVGGGTTGNVAVWVSEDD